MRVEFHTSREGCAVMVGRRMEDLVDMKYHVMHYTRHASLLRKACGGPTPISLLQRVDKLIDESLYALLYRPADPPALCKLICLHD